MSDSHVFGRDFLEFERNLEVYRPGGSNNSNNFDTTSARVNQPTSEVHHLQDLSHCLEEILQTDFKTDVTFVLDDGEHISAHRIILAARSKYFKALLYNGMRESNSDEIKLPETNAVGFNNILRYCYTGKITFADVDLETLLYFLALSHRYELLALVTSIADHLKEVLTLQTLCNIFNAAQYFALDDLVEYCMSYSDRHAAQLLSSTTFVTLSAQSLIQLLKRDSFYAPEIDIFTAVKNWALNNPEEKTAIRQLLDMVRLPLISQNDLLHHVRPSKLIEADALLDAISVLTKREAIVDFRGVRIPDVNVATSLHGASVVSCDSETGKRLLCEDVPDDMKTAVHYNPRQSNQCGSTEGIVIDLGKPHIINLFIIDLCSKSELTLFSYTVDVSIDNRKDWRCIADYSSYSCRRRQRIYFNETVVRYVRIRCSDKLVPQLIIKGFEAYYASVPMPVDPKYGLVMPTRNIATVEDHAMVVEGVSRCRNVLINGEINNYDWDKGYTCHQIGSGGIVVELPQPYLLSSMRLLLWNCDDRFYSYYVAVSINQSEWITVVDRTKEKCTGWQDLRFHPIPAVYIKLVGTRNSTNEVFHVVHLEAPSTSTL